jgi:hypothetical protein
MKWLDSPVPPEALASSLPGCQSGDACVGGDACPEATETEPVSESGAIFMEAKTLDMTKSLVTRRHVLAHGLPGNQSGDECVGGGALPDATETESVSESDAIFLQSELEAKTLDMKKSLGTRRHVKYSPSESCAATAYQQGTSIYPSTLKEEHEELAVTPQPESQIPLAMPGAFRVYPSDYVGSTTLPDDYSDERGQGRNSVVAATDNHIVLDAVLAVPPSLRDVPIQRATQVDPTKPDKSRALRRRAVAFVFSVTLVCIVGISVGIVASENKPKETSFEYQIISFEQFRDTRLPPDSLQRSAADKQSPQSRALQWLEESLDGSTLVSWRIVQRYALAVLYFALNGEGWFNNTGWVMDAHECTWPSLADHSELSNRIWDSPCDASDRYVSLAIADNNVTGSVPPEIGLLTNLESIDLAHNYVVGEIPTNIGILTKLLQLLLSDNDLVGSIPSEIGRLQQLSKLRLDENQLTGAIPTEIGMLLQISYISASHNLLTGSLPPQIGMLANAQTMYLNSNRFNSTIPLTVSNMTSLNIFQVGWNLLSGTIPTEIALLKNVNFLSLERNEITGRIPTHLGLMPILSELYLERTMLSGAIPSEL